MPVFSFGGMRFQEDFSATAKDKPDESQVQANAEAIVRRAMDVGINHIETARGYGDSEQRLGRILQKLPRDQLIVQTKIGPNKNAKEFVEHVHESLTRFNLDHIDLLSLHGVNTHELVDISTGPGGCFAAAQQLRRQGKVRFVGFSTHGPLDVMLRAINFGQAKTGEGFDYFNVHWYFIFQRNWPAIEAATARDMGVFIISPSDKGGHLYRPPDKLTDLCRPLHPMAFNDLFCLSHPQVHTLSLGAARPSDFNIHLRVLDCLECADEVLAPIIDRLGAAMREAVGVDDPEAMGRGLPDAEQMPGGLNVTVMLWLRNLLLGWDMAEYAKMRFNLLGNGGHWFAGAKPDELKKVKEKALREAVAGSPYADQIPRWLDESVELLAGEAVQRETQRS